LLSFRFEILNLTAELFTALSAREADSVIDALGTFFNGIVSAFLISFMRLLVLWSTWLVAALSIFNFINKSNIDDVGILDVLLDG